MDDEGLIERISELRGIGLSGAGVRVLHVTIILIGAAREFNPLVDIYFYLVLTQNIELSIREDHCFWGGFRPVSTFVTPMLVNLVSLNFYYRFALSL